MKNKIVKSVLTLLMIIEFYPVESNSQDLPDSTEYETDEVKFPRRVQRKK